MKWTLSYLTFMLAATAAGQIANTLPALPNGITTSNWKTFQGTVMDTTMPTQTGQTYNPSDGVSLRVILSQAQPGDTIILNAGTIYQPPSLQACGGIQANQSAAWCLPNITSNPNGRWIVIESSDMASLPAAGNRLNPYTNGSDSQPLQNHMPKMTQIANGYANQTIFRPSYSNDVGRWRFIGIEIYPNSNAVCGYNTTPTSVSNCYTTNMVQNQGSYFVLDRCWLHGFDGFNVSSANTPVPGDPRPRLGNRQDVNRAFAIGAAQTADGINFVPVGNVAVIDSYFDQIHASSTYGDTQAIGGWTVNGPIKVNNNYMSSSGEQMMLGGAGNTANNASTSPVHPHDIEVQHNHLHPDPNLVQYSWMNPITWQPKDNWECKDATRILLYGNYFDESWATGCANTANPPVVGCAEHGQNVRLTVRVNQSGNGADCDDITAVSNISLQGNIGYIVGPFDDACNGAYNGCIWPAGASRFLMANNLWVPRDSTQPGAYDSIGGFGYQSGNGILNHLITHNTIVAPPNYSTAFPDANVRASGMYMNCSGSGCLGGVVYYTQANGYLGIGSGYTVGDTGTINNCTVGSNPVTYTVSAINASGGVTVFSTSANAAAAVCAGVGNPAVMGYASTTTTPTTCASGTCTGFTVQVNYSGQTHDNVWVTDNVMWSQFTGASAFKGNAALNNYIPTPTASPNAPSDRFKNNLMGQFNGETLGAVPFPAATNSCITNGSTACYPQQFIYTAPTGCLNSPCNYELTTPYAGTTQSVVPGNPWSDGSPAGIENSLLMAATATTLTGQQPTGQNVPGGVMVINGVFVTSGVKQ